MECRSLRQQQQNKMGSKLCFSICFVNPPQSSEDDDEYIECYDDNDEIFMCVETAVETEVDSTYSDDSKVVKQTPERKLKNDYMQQQLKNDYMQQQQQQYGITPSPFRKERKQFEERSIQNSDHSITSSDDEALSIPQINNYSKNDNFAAEDALASAMALQLHTSFQSQNTSWRALDMSEHSVSDLSACNSDDSHCETKFGGEGTLIQNPTPIA